MEFLLIFVRRLQTPDKPGQNCYTVAQRDCDVIFLAVWHPANLVNSNEVRAVRRGGNVNNGANAGPCYFNANNAVSNANWNYGAALILIQRPAWPLMRYPCRAMPHDLIRRMSFLMHILFRSCTSN